MWSLRLLAIALQFTIGLGMSGANGVPAGTQECSVDDTEKLGSIEKEIAIVHTYKRKDQISSVLTRCCSVDIGHNFRLDDPNGICSHIGRLGWFRTRAHECTKPVSHQFGGKEVDRDGFGGVRRASIGY